MRHEIAQDTEASAPTQQIHKMGNSAQPPTSFCAFYGSSALHKPIKRMGLFKLVGCI